MQLVESTLVEFLQSEGIPVAVKIDKTKMFLKFSSGETLEVSADTDLNIKTIGNDGWTYAEKIQE